MLFSKSFLSLVALAVSVNAHAIFQGIGVNGVMEARHDFMRLPYYNGPIENVNDAAMACNGGPNPLQKISPNVKTVRAGDEITMQWSYTLDSDLNGMVIDASHKGPVMAYMAKVASATGPAPSSGWFKIYEDGYSNGVWAVDKLIANKGKVTVKIPDCIQPGDYLFRGELIALHAAGSYPGAQLYMECAQLRVTGGGSATPATVSFPGAYSSSDPGIRFNLYTPNISYTIPGPRPFTCSAGGNPNPNPQPQPTTTPAPQPTSTQPAPAPTTTAAQGGTIPKYGQCGGQGWNGSGSCVAGSTCVVSNQWYSQCL